MPEDNLVPTPYDDAFRTMLNDCSDLLIPVINEVFGKHYTGKEPIIPHPNIHFLNQQDGNEEKRITDGNFTIASDNYLFECQARPDNSLLIRIFEYGTQIALDSGVIVGDQLIVRVPNTAILFLRSYKTTPDKMTIKIQTPGGDVEYDVLTLKIKNYSVDDLFAKKLYFLLPFYIFTHEADFPKYNEDAGKLDELKDEYIGIMRRLDEAVKSRELQLHQVKSIVEMSKLVLRNLAAQYDNVKEGVDAVMGGRVLEYESKTIYNEGVAQGLAKGRAEGRSEGETKMATLITKLLDLHRDGDVARAVSDPEYRAQLYLEFGIA